MEKCKVAILGGTGYGAGELLRLAIAHPSLEVVFVTSASSSDSPIADTHTHLAGFYDMEFSQSWSSKRLDELGVEAVFCALPHGVSGETVLSLVTELDEKVKIIDFSGDFRLLDKEAHERHYGTSEFAEDVRSQVAYGLPELCREKIASARIVANPGCLAAASALAAAPLLSLGLKGSLVFDAKTGTSGGGKSPKEIFHHPSRHASIEAYNMLKHRHEPEITRALGEVGKFDSQLFFVPHLIPVSRGIFVTLYAEASKAVDQVELHSIFESFYSGSPFVRIRNGSPRLEDVVGSNFCDIGVVVRGSQIVVMAAIDNLVKGMAGTAIQNLNLMRDISEVEGLWTPALSLI